MIAERRVWITPAFYLLAAVLGLLIAYQDVLSPFGDDNAKVTLLLLIAASGLLGVAQPQHPLRLGFGVGIYLPMLHFLRHLLGAPAPDFGKMNAYLSILLLAVISLTACLIASFCGSLLRKTLSAT